MRILVLGRGRMGSAVERVAPGRGHEVLGPLGREEDTPDWKDAEVVVDFSAAAAVTGNVERALTHGLPIVVGTTGWEDQRTIVADLVEAAGGTLVWGANFSLGYYLMRRLAESAAEWAARFQDYDASLFEHHHRGKRDAPSGSGLELAQTLIDRLPGKARVVTDLRGSAVPADGLHVTSLRAGAQPGLHRIEFDGPFDSVSVEHRVRDRSVFALGALFAAEQSVGRSGMIHFGELVDNWVSEETTWS